MWCYDAGSFCLIMPFNDCWVGAPSPIDRELRWRLPTQVEFRSSTFENLSPSSDSVLALSTGTYTMTNCTFTGGNECRRAHVCISPHSKLNEQAIGKLEDCRYARLEPAEVRELEP